MADNLEIDMAGLGDAVIVPDAPQPKKRARRTKAILEVKELSKQLDKLQHPETQLQGEMPKTVVDPDSAPSRPDQTDGEHSSYHPQYLCPNCAGYFESGDWRSQAIWVWDSVPTGGNLSGRFIVSRDHSPIAVDGWACNDGCLNEGKKPTDLHDLWWCNDCEDEYENKEAADNCCN